MMRISIACLIKSPFLLIHPDEFVFQFFRCFNLYIYFFVAFEYKMLPNTLRKELKQIEFAWMGFDWSTQKTAMHLLQLLSHSVGFNRLNCSLYPLEWALDSIINVIFRFVNCLRLSRFFSTLDAMTTTIVLCYSFPLWWWTLIFYLMLVQIDQSVKNCLKAIWSLWTIEKLNLFEYIFMFLYIYSKILLHFNYFFYFLRNNNLSNIIWVLKE